MKAAQAHHDLPWLYETFFRSRGLDVNDAKFGRWVEGAPYGPHQSWTLQFNREWEAFINAERDFVAQKGRLYNADDIIAKMNQMIASGKYPNR